MTGDLSGLAAYEVHQAYQRLAWTTDTRSAQHVTRMRHLHAAASPC